MPRFAEIFDAQTLDHRSETVELNERARTVGWTVLHPGESICLEDDRQSVVISGITWSKPDLGVLDELATRDTAGTRVWFFNIDDVFPDEHILPGAELPRSTPIFAEYDGKRLLAFTQGAAVIDRIRNRFPTLSIEPK